MVYDVVVVGGGFGGLSVAALLAAGGLNVCLFERNSQLGGCIGKVTHSGFDFEPGMGVYTGWGPGENFEQLFAQLPIDPPQTQLIDSDYIVRLPDGANIHLRRDWIEFTEELRKNFTECSTEAVAFYEAINSSANFPGSTALKISDTSSRFRRFIDAQLRAFVQTSVTHCPLAVAARVLSKLRQNHYVIDGGPSVLVETLATAITRAGGKVRLDSPVLRLAFDERGNAAGVDLLSGERVFAKRAVISNMTVWDTYGKLIGLSRTPADVKKQLGGLASTGVYVVYAVVEGSAFDRLPGERFLACADEQDESSDFADITFATSAISHETGRRAVTIKTNCSVDEWFTFQSAVEELEEWDQQALEMVWNRLHGLVPELGAEIEVIETANPRSFYEDTRRKLGMVLGVEQRQEMVSAVNLGTNLPNVFITGDTISPLPDLGSVTEQALSLARIVQELAS